MSKHTEYCKSYYAKNRVAILLKKQEYNKANPGLSTQKGRAQRRFNIDSWKGFIPTVTQCQMCGIDIYFGCKDRRKAIHFDHRDGSRHSFRTPYQFLVRGRRTPKREAEWKAFNFGMLCMTCNTRIPTDNRVQFLNNLIRYMNMGRSL